MHRLKLLALKRREAAQDAVPASFDDMVLADFAETLSRMDSSDRSVSIPIMDGLSVDIKIPVLQEVSWAYHLTHMRCVVDQMPLESAADAKAVCLRIMAAEGWVWGLSALKTPAWMVPCAEILYRDLASHGFDWACDKV